MDVERHIVAIGGAGLSVPPDDPLLERFLLELSGKPRPKVCFLGTATGDTSANIVRFYTAFRTLDCRPYHVELFGSDVLDLHDRIMDADVVYIGGGNTANMLAVWRVHGVDRILREAWETGKVMGGTSAGSLCWFECGVTDSFGPQLEPLHDGLGLIFGSNCPHYDGEPRRRPVYHKLIAGGFPSGIAADDGVALHFVQTYLREVVSWRPGASAYRVELREGAVEETTLGARLLR